MAISWFLCPYKRVLPYTGPFLAMRYCAMDDFTAAIKADGGDWTETEVLGNHAIVKVRASSATLTTIAAEAGFTRLPVNRLDDPLSSLSAGVKTAIRNKVLSLGYTEEEVTNRFGDDIGSYTLRQLLHFVATRRRKPRWDAVGQEIVLDGIVQACRPIATVDAAVAE